MTPQLSRPVRRLAAVGLLLATLLMAAGAIEPAANRLFALGREIEAGREQVGRLAAMADGALPTGVAAQSGRRTESAVALYLDGESDAIRTANLHAMVGRAVEATGLRLQSAQSLPGSRRGGLPTIGLRILLQSDLAALQRLLVAMDTHRPLLVVDAVQVSRDGPTGPERMLQVEFHVLALMPDTRAGAP